VPENGKQKCGGHWRSQETEERNIDIGFLLLSPFFAIVGNFVSESEESTCIDMLLMLLSQCLAIWVIVEET
jgi:hypothetical protein